jgi:hypothetical protein
MATSVIIFIGGGVNHSLTRLEKREDVMSIERESLQDPHFPALTKYPP